MREVGTYSFRAELADADEAALHFADTQAAVERWIASKGTVAADGRQIRFKNGKTAQLGRGTVVSAVGGSSQVALEEPIDAGTFRTTVSLAHSAKTLYFHCVMEVNVSHSAAPRQHIVLCPGVVREVAARPIPWKVGPATIPREVLRLRGRGGGEALAAQIFDRARTLPLIVVSEQDGFQLHPEIDQRLARDLVGLAQVISIDDEASWGLTRTRGPEWSCFNGAVRVYWRMDDHAPRPWSHFLWTASRLMQEAKDTAAADKHLRARVRSLLFESSAFVGALPRVFADISAAAQEERIAARLKYATDTEKLATELADDFEKRNRDLEGEVTALRKQVADQGEAIKLLDGDLKRERWLRSQIDDREERGGTEQGPPPQTVLAAIQAASKACLGEVVFGGDVEESAQALSESAGPPDKLFRWLVKLAEAARHRRANAIKVGLVDWLNENGVTCSGEGLLSAKDKKRRVWDDGTGERVQFDWHAKVKEATSPDQCVRVYFLWDDDRKMIVVGYIGRHP